MIVLTGVYTYSNKNNVEMKKKCNNAFKWNFETYLL